MHDLRTIPGVGPRMAEDLIQLGYGRVRDLRGQDPEEMYRRLGRLRGAPIDRCVLYVFRCAVYFASHDRHEPRLLKWWSWKDTHAPGSKRR
ncbi:MAG: helix-hairpin-helix domain-containing protein [Phycisphaerae bacterium]|nr:helix-hairpin-helix domain-containing protein [Phycisphaerae bacterium]